MGRRVPKGILIKCDTLQFAGLFQRLIVEIKQCLRFFYLSKMKVGHFVLEDV